MDQLRVGIDGGDDCWEVQEFVEPILEDREPTMDIHASMDMTLPGLVSQQSIRLTQIGGVSTAD